MANDPVTLVILGASGDLTKRLLLPGLGTLLQHQPQRRVRLVGAANEQLSESDWRARVTNALGEGGCPDDRAERLASTATYRRTDLLDPDDLRGLIEGLPEGPAVLYFALPPAVTAKACDVLAGLDLPEGLRFGLEKPFGHDLASARRLNRRLLSFLDEDQIFRVDHFLGKGAVLNLLGFRFANRLFEPVWNQANIESVDIVFDETLALEGRAGYYDKAGALADMIQSHLLLVCALVAMEDPASIEATEFRDLVSHVLSAMSVRDGDAVASSRRARYTRGAVQGQDVPNYVDEPGVDADRHTETLAEVTVTIDNARWAGVPFRLRSGKALGAPRRQIVVTFRPVAHLPGGLSPRPKPNRLVIDMNPERVTLEISTNGEGDVFGLEQTLLSAEIGASAVRPYGEILAHIMDGDPLLSVRGDMAEKCWKVVSPVVDAWRKNKVPLEEYPAGSSGPDGWPA
ncbi:glucose-6-phosphate dehydrogenase [Agilicoccus flavus]|uniref:glucose-6-phosphate dehydrogenase n=1 Tax=Agilicoccus flavus TaxID=2775968 RepID=UPI001CF67A8B|nr:glucose-6-phosphate dehydrogenase [Agilicoccus flavus]